MIDFKSKIVEMLNNEIEGLNKDDILELIEMPPNPALGDYAFPCFKLAKIYRKSPNVISQEIAANLNDSVFEKIENTAAYVNFFIDPSVFAKTVTEEVNDKKEMYGSSDVGLNKKVIVEFSSPNIAKPFHIGHIRSTVIGNSIYKIYKFLGYDTVTINHLGDYGTQFGKLIVAFKKWGVKEEVEANPIPTLLKLYIKLHEEAETDSSLEDESRMWFKKLEQKDEEALMLWKWFREVSLTEFERVYSMLNIKFDSYAGESFYSDKMPRVLDMLEEKSLLKESKGADIVDLDEFNMPPALIRKSDGSTLYITRDITAAIYRKEHYDFYKNIYVVASQQNLHFQQWFKVVELMGNDWAKDCIHVPFGLVSLEDGTMSTRKGRVVFLEDVLNKAYEKTKQIIEEKNNELDNIDEVANQVGIGAVMFQELSNSRIKDYTFSWERTLNFDGETGPYVQYTHARACSVLKKAQVKIDDDVDYKLLSNENEMNLIRIIAKFPEIVQSAADKNEPSIITRYIVNVAQGFNKFYHGSQIIVDDIELQKTRLSLLNIARITIANGLGLLGIAAPERM